MSRVPFLLMLARVFLVVIDSCSLIAFQCFLLVCFRGYLSETMRACDRLHLRNPTYQQARTCITYDPFYFNQRFACQSRIGSMFDTTTRLQPLSNRYIHVPSQQTMYCYVTCSLLSPCLLCMLGCYFKLLPLLLLGLGYHLILIIVVNDMITIMLTIFDEGWKV